VRSLLVSARDDVAEHGLDAGFGTRLHRGDGGVDALADGLAAPRRLVGRQQPLVGEALGEAVDRVPLLPGLQLAGGPVLGRVGAGVAGAPAAPVRRRRAPRRPSA
jgi:hypothetical protein